LWCRRNNRRKTKSELIRENILRENKFREKICFFSAFQNHFINFFFIFFSVTGEKSTRLVPVILLLVIQHKMKRGLSEVSFLYYPLYYSNIILFNLENKKT